MADKQRKKNPLENVDHVAAGKKSGEVRRKKKLEKMFLQQCMRDLLSKQVVSENQKDALRKMGFDEENLTNKTLLMAALFRKGITGDVSAISKILDMMDKLDLYDETNKLQQQGITINLVTTGEQFQPSEELQRDIMLAENGEFISEPVEDWDDDEDWGTDIYNG